VSASQTEIRKFQRTLKNLIFGKGLHYQDLAVALEVSVSTAKRLLNRDDLSLDTIVRICAWLQIDFYKLVEMTREATIEWEYFTHGQEEYLASHPGHYKFLRLLLRGLAPATIMEQEGISEKRVRVLLFDLERIDLLDSEQSTADDLSRPVKARIGPRPDFIQYGPLWQTFFRDMASRYLDHYFSTAQTRKHHQIEYGQRLLSPESYRLFCREVEDLYKKYAMISEVEVETHPPEKLEKMSCLMLVDNVWVDWLTNISLK